jgi:hypothetical protein
VVAKGDVAEALPDCADPYPGNDFTRLEGFVAPPDAECTCECQLSAAGCYMYTYNETAASPDYCYASYGYPMSEGCYALAQPVTSGLLMVQSYPNFGGGSSCDQTASENIPEIPWEAVVKGCTGGYTDEVCDVSNRICYNRPSEGFEQQICYIAQGDIPCPPNTDYQHKTIRWSAVEDNRDCTQCQCGQLNYCLDEYEYFTTADCSGAAAGTVANGICTDNITASAVNFDFSGVTCPITSESEPEGEANPLDPWTYCCSEPM